VILLVDSHRIWLLINFLACLFVIDLPIALFLLFGVRLSHFDGYPSIISVIIFIE